MNNEHLMTTVYNMSGYKQFYSPGGKCFSLCVLPDGRRLNNEMKFTFYLYSIFNNVHGSFT